MIGRRPRLKVADGNVEDWLASCSLESIMTWELHVVYSPRVIGRHRDACGFACATRMQEELDTQHSRPKPVDREQLYRRLMTNTNSIEYADTIVDMHNIPVQKGHLYGRTRAISVLSEKRGCMHFLLSKSVIEREGSPKLLYHFSELARLILWVSLLHSSKAWRFLATGIFVLQFAIAIKRPATEVLRRAPQTAARNQ